MSVDTETRVVGGIGQRAIRPDGIAKVRGEFSFAGDLWADGMLWGQALRSPHPSARIRSIDIGPALAITGVHAGLLLPVAALEIAVSWIEAITPLYADAAGTLTPSGIGMLFTYAGVLGVAGEECPHLAAFFSCQLLAPDTATVRGPSEAARL